MHSYSSHYTFAIIFEGAETVDHSMSVSSWASSLLGWNDLIKLTAQSIDRSDYTDLRVTAIRRGSFGAEFVLSSALTVAVVGVLPLVVEHIRHRKSQPQERMERAHISTEEVAVALGPANMARLIDSPGFQKALTQSVSPLTQPGIDKITIMDRDQVLETITKVDLPLLDPTTVTKERIESQRPLVLVAPVLDQSNRKWQLREDNDGRAYSFGMLDADFLLAVYTGEITFASGDTLICDIRYRETYKGSRRIRIVREIVKVHDLQEL